MAGIRERFVAFWLGQDMAVNGLGGGLPRETLSGTAGRAIGVPDPATRRWWGPVAVALIDLWFGEGHCAQQASLEATRRGS